MASKRRIRWDRISVAAIVLVLLIFLLGSCVSRCTANKTGTAETSKESSEATAEQTTAPPAETQPPETKDPAAQTMANVPVMITDAEPSHDLGSTTTAAEESSEEPAYVLPAGYQEIPVQANAVYNGTLVLVNAANPSHLGADELELEQVYYADDRQDTYEISYPGHTSLNKGALAKFNRLMKAYYSATANKEIMFNYGYLETNQEKSNPESSTGLDVQLHLKHDDGAYEYVQNVAPYSWLFDHMASYGYILRYPPDKSDLTGERGGYTAIRYVGVPHAAYMAEKGLCLEEYLDMLKKEHDFFSGTILEYSTSELTYHIYYVPVGVRDNLSVPVPKGGSYEISGNNIDGFIVTAIVG